MKAVDIMLSNNENFKFVACVFAPYTGTRSYSYKTMLDLVVGDYVVVDTPSNGFQVVEVVGVVVAEDFDGPDIAYKWVVCRVDLEQYKECQQLEAAIHKEIHKSKSRSVYAALKAELQSTVGEETVNAIAKLSRL
jgi:hypothetical protein